MERRRLGSSDLQVSIVGLGCNNFGRRTSAEASRLVIERALEVGINHFDTADVYGRYGTSEEIFGEVLGARRKDVVLATKFGMPMDDAKTLQGASRDYIQRACEASLRRLKTDWIDLYYLHQPDPHTSIEETLRALDELIRAGKVRYVGCSNLAAWQVVEAHWSARAANVKGFICAQDEYSLLVRGPERELIPALQKYGLNLVPYFPLASGLLTGKYRRDYIPEGARLATTARFAQRFLSEVNWGRVEALEQLCAARGRTLLELAFSWLAAQPLVSSIIAGATSPAQVDQNADAVNWRLSPDDLDSIDRITRGL